MAECWFGIRWLHIAVMALFIATASAVLAGYSDHLLVKMALMLEIIIAIFVIIYHGWRTYVQPGLVCS